MSVGPGPNDNGILCGFEITLTAKAVSDTCFPGKDAEFKAFLTSSLAKYTAFTVRNTDQTLKELNSQVEQRMQEISKQPGLCAPEGGQVELYSAMRISSAAELKAAEKEIDELLAVDRIPTLNPCL
ncbi:hypothetical protein OIU34_28430 [Pararhizobium sp. BT-229]|uniref:hypothetical protein n=1 Tax=Pararhizobium sp. BT-229 TaxID=2986923 RepID=UPI0021F6CA41|nr:hypothetical protein [Pararhizobium sp. BT-229]MCV9965801.1 hypothetical protein [Pararhizobium sp. BT-229]